MFRQLVSRLLALSMSAALVMIASVPGQVSAQDWNGKNGRWDGFYGGLQLGGAWSDLEWRFENANHFNQFGGNVVGTGFDHGPNGLMGGVLGGYNHQFGAWVLGVEFTANAADMSEHRPQAQFPLVDLTTSQVDWLTTAKGRLGYAFDRLLVFADGGWAGAQTRVSLADRINGVFAVEEQWVNGWTLGGGVEYKYADWGAFGVSYSYADLNADSKTITCVACSTAGNGATPLVTGDVNVQSIMARMTFFP